MLHLIWAISGRKGAKTTNIRIIRNTSIGYLFIDQSESGLHFLKLMPPLSKHFEVPYKMADEIVGKRILCEGFRGEIKYVGLVPPTSGTYIKNISSDIKQLEWC